MNTILCPKCQTPIDIDQVVAQDIEHKLKQELWKKAQIEAKKRAEQDQQKAVTELQEQLQEQQKQLKLANDNEAELRRKQRELDAKEKQFELTLERELDKKLQTAQLDARKLESERFFLKEKEYQKQIDDMKRLVEEAQRKATPVSQQLQGEVLELELEKMFRESFPGDTISEVKKGQQGADVIHTVKDNLGRAVGTIIWESKQTEHFSDKWLSKLREDCRASNGSVAVLVTRTLPDDVQVCAERDHVWITNIEFALPLAALLRQTLLKVAQEKTTQSGKDVKTELLFTYINSQEFRGRVEGIVESFRDMNDDLDKEQRAMLNLWKKRKKQILRLATNTAYMYGELQGIVGNSLPIIDGLELDPGNQMSLAESNQSTKDSEKKDQDALFSEE